VADEHHGLRCQAQISEALRARGLPYEGLKRELVNRLHSALQRAAVGGKDFASKTPSFLMMTDPSLLI
jgi:hypothetical protein